MLALPFSEAVATGDGYYLVWPKGTPTKKNIDLLYDWLKGVVPEGIPENLTLL